MTKNGENVTGSNKVIRRISKNYYKLVVIPTMRIGFAQQIENYFTASNITRIFSNKFRSFSLTESSSSIILFFCSSF